MIKKIYLPLMLLVALAFVGCNKDMKPLSADSFKVTPSPLEVVGGQVPATITGTFPEKYFNKKAVVTVTPYLVYSAGETASASQTFRGEKVQGNDPTIQYKAGGVVTIPANFTYIPEMQKSSLYLAFTVQQGSKTYELPRVKVAEGVIAAAGAGMAVTVEVVPCAFGLPQDFEIGLVGLSFPLCLDRGDALPGLLLRHQVPVVENAIIGFFHKNIKLV